MKQSTEINIQQLMSPHSDLFGDNSKKNQILHCQEAVQVLLYNHTLVAVILSIISSLTLCDHNYICSTYIWSW